MLARAGSKRPIPRSESRRHLAPFQSKTEDTHSLSAQTRQTNSFATGYVFLYRTGRKNGRSKSLLRLMDVETGRDNDGNFVYSHARGREMFPVEEGNPKNESALNCLASPPSPLPPFLPSFLSFLSDTTLISGSLHFPSQVLPFTATAAAAVRMVSGDRSSSRCSTKFIFSASLWTFGLRRRLSELVSPERTASLPH